jgi:hypothetical protein
MFKADVEKSTQTVSSMCKFVHLVFTCKFSIHVRTLLFWRCNERIIFQNKIYFLKVYSPNFNLNQKMPFKNLHCKFGEEFKGRLII